MWAEREKGRESGQTEGAIRLAVNCAFAVPVADSGHCILALPSALARASASLDPADFACSHTFFWRIRPGGARDFRVRIHFLGLNNSELSNWRSRIVLLARYCAVLLGRHD